MNGELKVGCAYGVTSSLSPDFLFEYRKVTPEVEIQICEHPDLMIEQAILDGNIDVGFTIGPVDTEKFDAMLIKSHQMQLLVNKKTNWLRKKRFPWRCLKTKR